MSASAYLAATTAIVERVVETQLAAIERAGTALADALRNGKQAWVFGTGHSHLLAEELYQRAGGLAQVRAVLEPSLMLHESAAKSSALERLTGLAGILLETYGIAEGDFVLVASNSGRNAVPVEFARGARDRGAFVAAVTSRAHAASVPSRVPGGAKLGDVAQVVLDNCGPPGDAVLPGDPGPAFGATSTVTGALIVQAVACHAVSLLDEPAVLRSVNA